MNTALIILLCKDLAILIAFGSATAFTVASLALADPTPARAVLVLALMTPVIASAAVQLYHHLRAGRAGSGRA